MDHSGDVGTLRFPARLELTDGSVPWSRPPDWLAFFLDLGLRAAVTHEHGVKTCAVVIPPVRALAALFSATGAVVGVATFAEAIPDLETHFASLASLERGTRLVVKMGEKIYAGTFSGVEDRTGGPVIKIEYADGTAHILPKGLAHRVQVGRGGKRSLPKSLRRPGPEKDRAIEALLGDYATEFLSVPTVDVVLVGRLSILERELVSVRVRPHGDDSAAVPLGAILRPRRFLPDGGISRSLMLSDRLAEFEPPVDDTPHVVIFDGARAFSRHRAQFPKSSWVAVLDRCSASFREGVDVANQEFAVRHGPAPYLENLQVPAGTELQAFERAQ